MTTKEKLIDNCVKRGMFESQAKEAVELAIPELNNILPDTRITWDSDCSEYPSILHTLFFNSAKPIIYKWIEKNKPESWFKEVFL